MGPKFDPDQFLQLLLAGNREVSLQISNNLLQNELPIIDLYEGLYKKTMYKVGDLWESGKIGVSTEHIASAVVESNLNEHYPRVIANRKLIDKTVVTACVENEFHQIGIKMATDIFEMNGWNAHFLGANTSTTDLLAFLRNANSNMLALSLTISVNLSTLENMLSQVRLVFPRLPVIVGGQAFDRIDKQFLAKYGGVTFLPDLYSINEFLNNQG